MPQEMNVLCCYSCKMFQVHIVKKARKWKCKLCNAKQSIQQIHLQGSGRDCRLYVQQLNSLKANATYFQIAEQNNTSDNYSASEAEDEMPSETSPCDDVNNDCNFDNVDTSSETEDITDNYEAKNLQSTSCDHNTDPDKCNLQANSKFNRDVTNIFETNEELDEPLEIFK